MARESPGYRDQLESIITAFPKGERLTVADVAHYTGWSRRVVSRIFPFKELACICFGFVLGTAFTAVCLLADKKKAPARSCTSDKRNPKG